MRETGRRAAKRARPVPHALLGLVACAAIALATLFGWVPLGMGQAFGLMSGFAFLIYWMDKAAAQRQGRRVAENSLHLLALLCGWPGALLAQGLLRHKTQKMAFQLVFWLTVIANVGVMGWLLSSRA